MRSVVHGQQLQDKIKQNGIQSNRLFEISSKTECNLSLLLNAFEFRILLEFHFLHSMSAFCPRLCRGALYMIRLILIAMQLLLIYTT